MKSIKVTLNKPNPLFELWLEEWKKKAISQGSDLQHHFTKALNTLRKYPLPLDSGKDCIILKHFGLKLCTMLDRRLKEHKVHQKEMERTNNVCKCDSCCRSEFFLSSREKRMKIYKEEIRKYRTRQIAASKKSFCLSSWNFACYAILLTLYNKEGNSSYSELLYESKQLYNTSLKSLDPDIYDGKSSISILIASKLIYLKQFPLRYHLTEQGVCLTIKIKQIFNLENYDKHLLQIYFKKLQNSLPTQNYDCVMDETNIKAESIPKSSNEKNIENEENKQKSPLFNCLETSDQIQQNTIKLSSNVVDITLNGTQDKLQLKPYSFDIVLLVDTKETCGGKTKPQHDATLMELKQLGVLFEVRHLKIGDFTWIAKCKYTKKELILPYIVERKRLDDLSASIKDGRFHEQKFRLKQSGIENLLYIVEDHDKITRTGIPLSTLLQASINSLVQDNFIVKYTDSHQDSMSYLTTLTSTLCKIYAKKNLIERKKENLLPIDVSSDSILLMKFEEFNKAASKLKNFNVRQMFVRQLLQLKGMSVDKALAVVECYPTPLMLINALHKSDYGETLIANIQYGQQKRQIGPTISKTVYLFYTQQELK
ncbi:crossover junction endonuclease MUS81 [Vespula pensylvanica]|uniref:crossover junction endonuclease MUS81 n=1 Tax=Vespula pensylvanica TaxID=30213 RepID=UPI001CB9DE03|nr:crossover junction endonuclease MUS81 [Vespula pensylvanica]